MVQENTHGNKMPLNALFKSDAKNSMMALPAHLPFGLDDSSHHGLNLTKRARLSANLDHLITSIFLFVFIVDGASVNFLCKVLFLTF